MLAKTVYYVFVINILRCIKKIGEATLFADLLNYKRKSKMEKTASLEQLVLSQTFSKSNDYEKIVKSYQEQPFFIEICAQLGNIHDMFKALTNSVPFIQFTDARIREKERLQQLKTTTVGNTIHVPFTEQLPPMYIVLREMQQKSLKQAQLQILPLLELCAVENRDAIILAGDYDPIVFPKGVVTYDAFMRFMSLEDVTVIYTFQKFVQQSIKNPIARNSQVVFVATSEQPFEISQDEYELYQELKEIFNCNFKAIVTQDVKQPQLVGLLEEVYVLH